jgi:hypothetical protein
MYSKCNIHLKELEAYCQTDKQTLCVTCIIENDHKNHDLCSIDKAVINERQVIEDAYCKSKMLEKHIEDTIIMINDYKLELDSKAKLNTNAIEDFFSEINNFINERKVALKRRISDVLETANDSLDERLNQIVRHKKLIEILCDERNKLSEVNEFEVLDRAKQNSRLVKEILVDIPKVSIDNFVFYDIKKGEEINNIKTFLTKMIKEKEIDKEKSYQTLNTNFDGAKSESTFNMSKKQKDSDKRIFELNKALTNLKKDDKIKSLKIMRNKNLEINFNINTNINTFQKYSPRGSEDKFKYNRPQIPRDSAISKRGSKIEKPKVTKSNRSSIDKSYLTNSAKKTRNEDSFKTDNTISLSNTLMIDSEKYIKKENKEFIIDEIPPQFEVTPLKRMNDSVNIFTDFDDFTSEKPLIDLKSATSTFKSFQQDLGSLYHEYNSNIMILGGKADTVTRKYCLESNSWTTCKTNVSRSDFVALMYKDKRILIMGGKTASNFGTETITDLIELFNLDDYAINRLEIKLKYPRSNFGAVFVNNTIYVCGGYNGKDVLNNVECFDRRTKKWIDLPKMSSKRKELCLVVGPNSHIFAIGGSDEKE